MTSFRKDYSPSLVRHLDPSDHDAECVEVLPLYKLPPLTYNWDLLRNNRCTVRRLLERTHVVEEEEGSRLPAKVVIKDSGDLWCQLGITPIDIFHIILNKVALTNLLIMCTFKDRR